MKVFLAITLQFVSLVATAASIYSPDLVLVKRHECAASPQFIINQPAGLYPAGFPYGEFTLLAGYLGPDATATAIGGEVGGYTGLHVDETALVRGTQPDPSLPPTAFQLACAQAGFLLNTAQVPVGDGSFIQYKVTWAIPSWVPLDPRSAGIIAERQPGRVQAHAAEIRPWARGRDSDLVLQASVRIPTVIVSGSPTVQYNLFFYVLDTVSGRIFDYIVNLYNNRGFETGSGAAHDGDFPFVSIVLPPPGSTSLDHRYYVLSPYSAGSSVTPWADLRFFRIHVGRHHLANAIQDLNAEFQSGLSLDPSDYLLIDAGVIQEHAHAAGSSVLIGSSLQDFEVYTANNPEFPRFRQAYRSR